MNKFYKCCAVPMCKSTTIKTPAKLFVFVPRKKQIREQWLTLAGRHPASINETSNSYYCEDHFDLLNDMENYMEYKMGFVSQIRMRPGCIPTKFDCQHNRVNISSDFCPPTPIRRRRSETLIEECEKQLDKNITEIEKPQNSGNICIDVPSGPSTSSVEPSFAAGCVDRDLPKKSSTASSFRCSPTMSTVNDFLDVHLKKEESDLECRLCLQSLKAPSRLYSVFEAWDPPWEGMEATIADDLNILAKIQVAQTDKLSKIICESCYDRLQSAAYFVKLVQRNDQFLKSSAHIEIDVASERIWPQPIQLDKNVSAGVYNNQMEVEVKQEVLSEEEIDATTNEMNTEQQQALCDASMEIKVEPEEITPQNPVSNSSKTGKWRRDRYRCTNDNVVYFTNEEYLEDIKEEVLSEEELESAQSDLPLDCMLCSRRFNSIFGLKAHVIVHHSYKTVRWRRGGGAPTKRPRPDKHVCTTCRRAFSTPTDLMVHETCHSSEVCYVCQMKFDSFEQLAKHRKRCTMTKKQSKRAQRLKTLDDVKRVHPQAVIVQPSKPQILTCHSCSEQFSEEYYLSIHQEIHHSTSNNDVDGVPTSTELNEMSDAVNEVAKSNFEANAEGRKVNASSSSKHIENEKESAKTVNNVSEKVKESLGKEEEGEKLVASTNEEKLEARKESTNAVNEVSGSLKEYLRIEDQKMEESISSDLIENETEKAKSNKDLEQVNEPLKEGEQMEAKTCNEIHKKENNQSKTVKNILERLRVSMATIDEDSSNQVANENELSDNVNRVQDRVDESTGIEDENIDASTKNVEKQMKSPEKVNESLEKASEFSETEGEQTEVSSSDKQLVNETETIKSISSVVGLKSDSSVMGHKKSEPSIVNKLLEKVSDDKMSVNCDLGSAEDAKESVVKHLESVDDRTEYKRDLNEKSVDMKLKIGNKVLEEIMEPMDVANNTEDVRKEAGIKDIPIAKQFLDTVPEIADDGDNKVEDMEIDSIETDCKILDSKITVGEYSITHSSSENVKVILESNKPVENVNTQVEIK